MSHAAIVTRGLRQRFGEVQALDGLDLEVPRGCVTGFLGPNGAGKTTTIRRILGLIRGDSGEVWIFGKRVRPGDTATLKRIGALVEMPSLYPHLSGQENLEVARRIAGGDSEDVAHSLEITGLSAAADRAVRGYSLGMRQRLGLALALLRRPELLILDEPTNGLDPGGIQETLTLLRRLAEERGVTVFLSSHRLSEVEQIASHLIVLRRGRAAFQGPPADLAQAGRSTVQVGVSRVGEAQSWLLEQGWAARRDGGERLQVEAPDAALLCRRLVEAGFEVHHLSTPAPALEARFLDLVADGEEEP